MHLGDLSFSLWYFVVERVIVAYSLYVDLIILFKFYRNY